MRDDKNKRKDNNGDIESDEEYHPTFAELEPHQPKLYFMTLQLANVIMMKTLNGGSSGIENEDTVKISENLQANQASSGVDGMLDAGYNGADMRPSGKERLMKDNTAEDGCEGDKGAEHTKAYRGGQ